MSTKIKGVKNNLQLSMPRGSLVDWLGGLGAEDIGVDLGSSNVVI